MSAVRWALIPLIAALLPVGAATEKTARETLPGDRMLAWREALAVAPDGTLSLAPSIVRVLPEDSGDGRARPVIWTGVDVGTEGLLLGTGHDGEVLRVRPGTGASVLFRAGEPEITAVLPGPQGDLFVAATPRGGVYRILADGRAELFAAVKARYLWDLAWDGAGRILAATGDPATLVRFDGEGTATVLFEATRESHLTSLLTLPGGVVLAGSDGLGRVYRVEPTGEASVLHDSRFREIAALARGEDGTVWAVAVAERAKARERPTVKVRVPGGPPERSPIDGRTAAGPTGRDALLGIIEGLDDGDGDGQAPRGALVRIPPDGRPARETWVARGETPSAVAVSREGTVMLGTGDPARVYRVTEEGPELVLEPAEGVVTSIRGDDRGGLVMATAQPGALYRILAVPAERGVFRSVPLDGGPGARWGSLGWHGSIPPGGGIEIAVRSGDSLPPGSGWSSWTAASALPGTAPLAVPPGRFLQLRARMSRGSSGASPELRDLEVRYRPANRPPTLAQAALVPPDGEPGATWTARWEGGDPDEDPLRVEIALADGPDGPWRTLATGRLASPVPVDPTSGGPGRRYLRVTLSDRPSNLPGEGASVSRVSAPVLLDPAPPTLGAVSVERLDDGTLAVSVEADAGVEGLAAAWVSADGGQTWWPAGARDGVLDGPRDRVVGILPQTDGGEVVVRVVDRSGAEARAVAPAR